MRTRLVSIALVGGLLMAACGGDDDDSDATTTTAAPAESTPATTEAPATTAAPETTTTVAIVVEGATVVVANASIVGGAAGRMTDALAAAGFTTTTATNATEKVEQSVVYYTDDEGAEVVAESVAASLGGVEYAAMPDPIPTEDGTLGDAQVLVMLGTNQADRTLDELASIEQVENNGSVVVVANASGVGGSAGRLTADLARAGFNVGEATNATEQRSTSLVHYSDTEGAEEDAELIATLMGGVDVEPLPDPIPTEDGTLDGDVLILLGSEDANIPLTELNP